MESCPIERRGLWRREGDRVYLCGTLGSALEDCQRAPGTDSAADADDAQR